MGLKARKGIEEGLAIVQVALSLGINLLADSMVLEIFVVDEDAI